MGRPVLWDAPGPTLTFKGAQQRFPGGHWPGAAQPGGTARPGGGTPSSGVRLSAWIRACDTSARISVHVGKTEMGVSLSIRLDSLFLCIYLYVGRCVIVCMYRYTSTYR